MRANQLWRLLGGCAEIISRRGYNAATVQAVCETAAVSKADFYRRFDGLPACILATYEMAASSVLASAAEACALVSDREAALTVGVAAVLSLLDAEPALGRVLTDPALEDVPGLPPRRAAFRAELASYLPAARAGRAAGVDSPQRPLLAIGGAHTWLAFHLDRGARGELVARAAELSQLLIL